MELKMMIAYIIMNYDIQLIGPKPKGIWLGSLLLPPLKARVLVRRRVVKS